VVSVVVSVMMRTMILDMMAGMKFKHMLIFAAAAGSVLLHFAVEMVFTG
jgi:hypothetical protein